MEIIPLIKELKEKKLVGMKMAMSLAENRTGELWRNFMMRRKEIASVSGTELYSVQVYDTHYFTNFNLKTNFEKWACAEVSDFKVLPEKMDRFILQSGLYAVFLYKGSSADTRIFNYIFSEWLPNSGYVLDNRPHFELLGEKYKNNDPDSEEEIWIPVSIKNTEKS